MMIEGDDILTNDTHAFNSSKGSISTTDTNVLTLKNRVVFADRFNLGKLKSLRLSIDNDHTKGAVISILKNATIAGTQNYQYINENNSIAIVDTAGTTVTGGELLDGFTVAAGGSISVNLSGITPDLFPEDTLTVVARAVSGTGATITAFITWRENK